MMTDVPTAALIENKHPDTLVEYLNTLQVDAYHLSDDLVNKSIIKELRKADFLSMFILLMILLEPKNFLIWGG